MHLRCIYVVFDQSLTAAVPCSGGLMLAGANVIFNAHHSPVIIEDNVAKNGGGLTFMAPVHLETSSSLIQGNQASQNGGGVYGFSNLAEMNVGRDHRLVIKVMPLPPELNRLPLTVQSSTACLTCGETWNASSAYSSDLLSISE